MKLKRMFQSVPIAYIEKIFDRQSFYALNNTFLRDTKIDLASNLNNKKVVVLGKTGEHLIDDYREYTKDENINNVISSNYIFIREATNETFLYIGNKQYEALITFLGYSNNISTYIYKRDLLENSEHLYLEGMDAFIEIPINIEGDSRNKEYYDHYKSYFEDIKTANLLYDQFEAFGVMVSPGKEIKIPTRIQKLTNPLSKISILYTL